MPCGSPQLGKLEADSVEFQLGRAQQGWLSPAGWGGDFELPPLGEPVAVSQTWELRPSMLASAIVASSATPSSLFAGRLDFGQVGRNVNHLALGGHFGRPY